MPFFTKLAKWMSKCTEFNILTCSSAAGWWQSPHQFLISRAFCFFWISPSWSRNIWTCIADPLPPLYQAFSTSALLTLRIIIFLWWCYLVNCRTYLCIPGPHPLDASNIPPPSQCDNQKYIQTCQSPVGVGGENHLLGDHCVWLWSCSMNIGAENSQWHFQSLLIRENFLPSFPSIR